MIMTKVLQLSAPSILQFILWWLPVVAAVATGLWTMVTFVNERANQTNAQVLQAQQPFLSKQLDLYGEVLKEVGKLVTLPRDDKEWTKSEMRFWQLYWSELSMVESGEVEGAMVRFANQLNTYKKDGPNLKVLEHCSYELAHAVRRSIQTRWQVAQSQAIGTECPQPDHRVS
jgi:hypothetical protein